MPSSFLQIETLCEMMGLRCKPKKNGVLWIGRNPITGRPAKTIVHTKSSGRDIPDPTLHLIIKQLGFDNEKQFYEVMSDPKMYLK